MPTSSLSLGAMLFGKAREAVIGVLFSEPDRPLHVRDIARRSGFSAQTIGRELRQLAGAEVLTSEESGRQLFYRANPACPLFQELRSIAVKTWAVQGQMAAVLEPLEGIECAFIFGSYAAGTQHGRSDIDLLVIGNIDFAVLSEAMSGVSSLVGREISVKLYRPEEWGRKQGEGNSFLLGVAQGPKIFVFGNEGALNGLGKPGANGRASPARSPHARPPRGRKPPRHGAGVRRRVKR